MLFYIILIELSPPIGIQGWIILINIYTTGKHGLYEHCYILQI